MKKEKAIVLCDETVREGHVVSVYNKKKTGEIGDDYFYVIYVQKDKKEFPIVLTREKFEEAVVLAQLNIEDIPKKSVLNNLTD